MEHIQKNAGRARPEKKACPSAWPADRARFSMRSACATAFSPVKWAPICRAAHRASITTSTIRTASIWWCATRRAARSLAPIASWPPENARQVGYYSENEFDLTRLQHLRSRLVEIGRSCVHPDYRTGGTITLLWSGLAQYMTERGYDYLMGCASISMADGGHAAASLYNSGCRSPGAAGISRLSALSAAAGCLQQDRPAEVPPLIKGYLRAGAWICGEPAWDPDFNTADLPILMPMAKVSGRYAKHYLGQEA